MLTLKLKPSNYKWRLKSLEKSRIWKRLEQFKDKEVNRNHPGAYAPPLLILRRGKTDTFPYQHKRGKGRKTVMYGLDHRFGQHPPLHRYQPWQAGSPV